MIILLFANVAADAASGSWYDNPGIVAILGTIVGGGGLKIIEKWLGKNTERQSERRDLREEVKELVSRIDTLESEVGRFRALYFAEQEKVALLRIMVLQLGGTLPDISTEDHVDSDSSD